MIGHWFICLLLVREVSSNTLTVQSYDVHPWKLNIAEFLGKPTSLRVYHNVFKVSLIVRGYSGA